MNTTIISPGMLEAGAEVVAKAYEAVAAEIDAGEHFEGPTPSPAQLASAVFLAMKSAEITKSDEELLK